MTSRKMRLRYAGTCSKCGVTLLVKAKAYWNQDARTVTCLDCFALAHRDVFSDESSFLPMSPKLKQPNSGRAGASAAMEHDRRHKKREAMLDQRFGRFAGVVKFLVDDPQSTRAWAKGASGEQELAEALTRRVGDCAVLLHDRKIPRTSANIDHIAVAASGVWIIDAKKYSGKLSRRDKGGWFTTDLRVYVGGRDRTKLVDGLDRQVATVLKALHGEEVEVHSVLCFIGAEWDFFLKPFQINGVWITYGKKLAELIAEPGSHSKDEVLRIANVLAEALPPKVSERNPLTIDDAREYS
jgi:hypothetical protein